MEPTERKTRSCLPFWWVQGGYKFPRHENYQCERLVNYLISLAFIVERQGFELCALSLNEGEGNRELFQLVADLGEARLGAGFVLVAAWCSAHTDGGDRFIANLDWQAADRTGFSCRTGFRSWRPNPGDPR